MKFIYLAVAIFSLISCTNKMEPGKTPGAAADGSVQNPGDAVSNPTPGKIYETTSVSSPGPYKNIEEFKKERRKKVQEAIDMEHKSLTERLQDPAYKSNNILLQKRAEKAKEAQEYVQKLREKGPK